MIRYQTQVCHRPLIETLKIENKKKINKKCESKSTNMNDQKSINITPINK